MRRLLLLACCCLCLPLSAVEAPRIGVLDLEAFLKSASLLTSRYEKLQGELDSYNEQFQEMGGRIKKLETRLSMTDQGDDSYDALEQDLETAKLRLKLSQQQAQKRLESRKATILEESIDRSMELLAAFSSENGYDIIVQAGAADPQHEVPIAQMPVLYTAPDYDITEDFIAFANARFQSASADAPATGSAPVLEDLSVGGDGQ